MQVTNNSNMNIKFKVCEGFDFKSTEEDGSWYIEAYTNTKNNPDSYGDIPTGDNVYQLKRYKKNPLLLVDHQNSAGMVAGVSVVTKEDETGLFQKFKLMKNPANPVVAHAIEAVKEGLVRAFSICGSWEYGDKDNPKHLTKAYIYEVSLVGIPADERAVSSSVYQKSIQEADQLQKRALAEMLISEYRASGDQVYLQILEKLKSKG